MKIKKNRKLSLPTRPKRSLSDNSNDFSSILYESPWERFMDRIKPIFKVLTVFIILGGLIYSGTLLFESNGSDKYAAETGRPDDSGLKLSECINNVISSSPSPETDDPEFYPKLIAGYDKKLECYDKHPGIDLAGKSNTENLRKSAIDSSGKYKDIYLASGGAYKHGSSTNHINTVTGCSYRLSESEYIKCTDDYNAKHRTSTSSTLPAEPRDKNPPYTNSGPSSNIPPTPSTPPSGSGPSSSEYSRSDWQRICEQQVRQSSGGTGLTQPQRDKVVARCMREHGY